ncbi:MAG: hypothetical protein KF788_18720 [Piscinibacter sp.]|nr:hypothetical protein [Piscinibacter sp.]
MTHPCAPLNLACPSPITPAATAVFGAVWIRRVIAALNERVARRRTLQAARRLMALAELYEPGQRSLAEDLRAAAHDVLAGAQRGGRASAKAITAMPPSPASTSSTSR